MGSPHVFLMRRVFLNCSFVSLCVVWFVVVVQKCCCGCFDGFCLFLCYGFLSICMFPFVRSSFKGCVLCVCLFLLLAFVCGDCLWSMCVVSAFCVVCLFVCCCVVFVFVV